jgi:uncharacterized protein YdcH (DUF465 family)
MEELDQQTISSLLYNNPRFRLLYEEHQFFERQLGDYDSRTFLTADEDLERKKLQKMKLAGKDEMHRIVSHFS